MLSFFTTSGLSIGDKLGTYVDFLIGSQTKRRDAQYFSASEIQIKAHRRQPISLDGDYFCKTPANFSVDPRALRVMVHQNFEEGE
jgi:diacylglycerol kinase family enzyme